MIGLGAELLVDELRGRRGSAGYGSEISLDIIVPVLILVLLLTVGIPLVVWLLAYALGRTIKGAIQTFDRHVLGTDVTIKDLRTNLFNGVVSIEGLEVHNPSKDTNKHCKDVYKSEYLLKAGVIYIDLNMASLFCSFFSHFNISKVEFKDVDVIVEKTTHSSNVQDVMNFLAGWEGDKAKDKKEDASAAKKEDKDKPAEESSTQITLHEVCVEDVGARLEVQMLGGRGMRVSVGDIHYHDFAEQVGKSKTGAIVQELLKSVLKTVAVNVLGKRIGESLM